MRRTKENAEKTRQAILDAALEVFYHRGVTRASLAEVAAAAGVTRGAVYHHFKDKFDLYFTLYEGLTEKYKVRPVDYANRVYDCLEEFQEDIVRLFRLFEEDTQYHMFVQVMYSRMEYIEEMQPVVDNEIRKQRSMISAFERALKELKARDKIASRINCKRYAMLLYALVDGVFDSWGVDEELYESPGNVNGLLDEIFHNLMPNS